MEDIAFVNLGIYRFTLYLYGNLNRRTLIGKEKYIHDLSDVHDEFCYAGSLTYFDWPYFVMYLSLGLINVKTRLIAGDDICERSIVVFRELY
jgi:hypothetical protein